MKKLILLFFFLGSFLFFTHLLAQNSHEWTLSQNGLGPIKIGMTLKKVAEIIGTKFSTTKPDPTFENESCFYTQLKDKKFDGILFMISGDKIVRIDINSTHFTTSTGARIGDSEERVKKLYHRKLKVEPHHYNSDGHYLTYKDGNKAIRFETNGKKVTTIYAGKMPEVLYVEGCL